MLALWDASAAITTFVDPPDAEEEFVVSFNAGKRRNDVASAVIFLLLTFVPMATLDISLFLGRPLIHAAAALVANTAILALATRTPKSRGYYLRRGWIMGAIQLTLILTYTFTVIPAPLFEVLHPLELPEAPGPRAGALLYFSLLLISSQFSHISPIKYKVPLIWGGLAVCWVITVQRCALEVDKVPGQGAAYVAMLNSTAQWVSRTGLGILGDPVAADIGGNWQFNGPGALAEYGACLAVHASVQAAVGVFLPLAVLIAEENLARTAFEREFALGTAFGYGPGAETVLNLALVPLEAAVGFQAVTAAVGVLQAAGLLRGGWEWIDKLPFSL